MFLNKYGVARHIYIPIIKRGVIDFAVSGDWTPASGDVTISKDGGAAANVTNLPSAISMGNGAIWDFSLTATEMQAAQIVVTVSDSATKAVEDQSFIIETYGNASGQHAFDLGTATQGVNVTQFGGSNGTFSSGRPEVNTSHIAGSAVSTASAQIGVNVVNAGGTAWGSGAITAASIASDAITAAKIADGAIDAATFAAGAINAAAIASDAITDAKVASDVTIASVTGAVGSVTGNVGGNVVGTVASVVGNVGGNVTGSVGSLATQAKADVNAEVVDALTTDTYAEPGQGAPAATASLAAKIGYLYKAWRNKVTQSGSQYSLYADDGTTIDQKATVADDGTTFTRGEVASGP